MIYQNYKNRSNELTKKYGSKNNGVLNQTYSKNLKLKNNYFGDSNDHINMDCTNRSIITNNSSMNCCTTTGTMTSPYNSLFQRRKENIYKVKENINHSYSSKKHYNDRNTYNNQDKDDKKGLFFELKKKNTNAIDK